MQSMEAFTIAARFVHFTAILLVLGASLFRLYAGIVPSMDAWLRSVLLFSAIAALVSSVLWWDSVAVRMGGGWPYATEADTLGAVLFETHFGEVWLWRLVLGAGLVLLLVLPLRLWGKAHGILITGLSALLVATIAPTGHAAMHQGPDGNAHQVSDMVHLLCAGAWLGGLVPLGYVLRHAQESREGMTLLRSVLPRFSRMGYWAVGLLLITGVVNTTFLVSSPANLIGTLYGRILIAKICLVLVMVGLAIVNRGFMVPKIGTSAEAAIDGSAAALWKSVAAEQSLGILVLVIVSVLGVLPPPH
jgi:putative copper resistance protein D